MKHILHLIALICLTFSTFAQNWFPVNRNGVNYYENNGNVISTYITDSSVQRYTLNKMFYRNCANNWLGKYIVDADSALVFFNSNLHPIVFNINTVIGDSNLAYSDDSVDIYFKHVQSDYKSILNETDSIKQYVIHVYDKFMQPLPHHKFSNQNINISKRFGLVNAFSFYYFPSDTVRYTLAGNSNIENGVQNITARDVFNYDIGDEFHYYHQTFLAEWNNAGNTLNDTTLEIRLVINKIETADSFVYTYKRRLFVRHYEGAIDTNYVVNDTLTEHIILKNYFYLNAQPGDLDTFQNQFLTYHVTTKYGNRAKQNIVNKSIFRNTGDTCFSIPNSSASYTTTYITGLGFEHDSFAEDAYTVKRLSYYKKGTTTWGTPWPANVGLQSIQTHLSHQFYPNPAASHVQITYQHHQPATLVIYSTTGQMVQQYAITSSTNIDISALANGLYFYEITSGNQTAKGKFVKQ
jgi:hypothetical protein